MWSHEAHCRVNRRIAEQEQQINLRFLPIVSCLSLTEPWLHTPGTWTSRTVTLIGFKPVTASPRDRVLLGSNSALWSCCYRSHRAIKCDDISAAWRLCCSFKWQPPPPLWTWRIQTTTWTRGSPPEAKVWFTWRFNKNHWIADLIQLQLKIVLSCKLRFCP